MFVNATEVKGKLSLLWEDGKTEFVFDNTKEYAAFEKEFMLLENGSDLDAVSVLYSKIKNQKIE